MTWRPAGTLSSVLAGVLLGLGGYTFRYAEGLSYLSDDPRAGMNCHVPHAFPAK